MRLCHSQSSPFVRKIKLAAHVLGFAGELELVRSGLDDTMRIAYQQMSQRWRSRDDVKDLRTAAFMLAIYKIAAGYRAKGT